MHFRYFVIISILKIVWPFIWTNLNPLNPWMVCAKFSWNWPSNSGEEGFKILSMYFCHFAIISPWKGAWPFIWTNLNLLYPRMFCVKFGWNWPSGSGEEDKDGKSLRTDVQTVRWTDGRRTTGDQKSSLEQLSAQVIWGNTNH